MQKVLMSASVLLRAGSSPSLLSLPVDQVKHSQGSSAGAKGTFFPRQQFLLLEVAGCCPCSPFSMAVAAVQRPRSGWGFLIHGESAAAAPQLPKLRLPGAALIIPQNQLLF